MKALICRWFGHRWMELYRIPSPGRRRTDQYYYQCARCKEPGWLV